MNRLKIGLPFFYDYKGWAGGVIYTLNILSSLKLVADKERPEMFIYYNDISPIEDVKKIDYPYIKYLKISNYPPSPVKSTLSHFSIKFFGRSFLFKEIPDLVYPFVKYLNYGKKDFYWIPDFQEKYYPALFTSHEIQSRNEWHNIMARNKNGVVVFSSKDAMKDFYKFYSNIVCTTALVRFASIIPPFRHVDVENLKQRFNIRHEYFIVTNQFWAHKNHKVVFEAIAILKNKNLNFQVAFTGSTRDKRNPEYFDSLEEFIKTNDIEKYVVFLGLLQRDEQLKLMEASLAVIQPSLFEGWSTVVEDTKAINNNIILSNIGVHKEQIDQNCDFFDPHDAGQLALLIERYLMKPPVPKPLDYTENIRRFGKELLAAFNS